MKIAIAAALAVTFLPVHRAVLSGDGPPGRWPASKAWGWYEKEPWICGFNYIPATSINTTEMWQAETFDAATIDAELALAEGIGFGCARVFLQYLVWEADPRGLETRLDRFLAIAAKRGIRTMPVLFDDCAFSTMTEPFLGKQPDVLPGEYANGWTPSPGPKRVLDSGAWPKLEEYVRSVIGRFRDDPRVLLWDLYNEPSNTGMGDRSLPLLEAVFDWARRAEPLQPLTAGIWGGTAATTRLSLERSDIASFHSYGKVSDLRARLDACAATGRPVICTEWLHRLMGSFAETHLPVFLERRVGCLHWGLVNGKTQTHFPWGSKAGAPEPTVWQHDIFRKDRSPYDPTELERFRETIRSARQGAKEAVPGRWSRERAWAWYEGRPWPVGCNFLPSTAVNDVEMWREATFDPATIDRELGWAEGLGFNSVRVFINFIAWKEDPEGLQRRFDEFLAVAGRRGISAMPILFDDCFRPEPRAGKQDEPIPGVHNSQWVSSPGEGRVKDPGSWGELERYVKDMVGRFGRDRRIIFWDLYNEPTRSAPLIEATFRWAREAGPEAPLTTCVFGPAELQEKILGLSDITSFHEYGVLPALRGQVDRFLGHGRPVVCTEWMARTAGSRFESHLPFFRERGVGCWNWGLVAGRTQTYYPWGSAEGAPEPATWFHDIFRPDGTPFSAREVRTIRRVTGKEAGNLPAARELVAAARTAPVEWSYSMEKPADGWNRPGFDDRAWKRGPAPFGVEEPPFDRHPRTEWRGPGIWLRREIEMPPGRFEELSFLLHHDEDVEVWIDGVLALRAAGYNAAYESYETLPEGRAALSPGKHLIALHCRQTGGGQYLDIGIEGIEASEAGRPR